MKYDDYLPVWDEKKAQRLRNGSRRCSWVPIAVAISVLLNVIFVFGPKKAIPSGNPQAPSLTALDNYQHLNSQPIVNAAFMSTTTPVNSNENMIVTSLYTDAFAPGVATLGHTLNKVNSSAGRLLLYLPEKISSRALCIATSTGFIPYPIKRIPPPYEGVHPHFLDQYSKLTLWSLDSLGVQSLVYLDADTLVQRNFDELFSVPFNFGAVPDVYIDEPGFTLGFNAGMLFLRPSSSVFERMVAQIGTANYRAEDAEQSFLNHFYGSEAVRLPYAYNANLAIKRRKPELWVDLKKEARVVHYTLVKPFLQGDYEEVEVTQLEKNVVGQYGAWGGLFKEELDDWAEAWRETLQLHGTMIAECRRGHYRV
ncbi:glycosyltransferase family 8 protein [Gelatoporia subvermispora B]|uniref:Glycosyltransferase family 8 protein n=1 Tax=Ceriporiopsis subvermispora (strain B) TaxID=914234 RepID=M2Q801_CERS8|nr:glycosyltransferase family 8 protein [Gelatoporia subvermispora B]